MKVSISVINVGPLAIDFNTDLAQFLLLYERMGVILKVSYEKTSLVTEDSHYMYVVYLAGYDYQSAYTDKFRRIQGVNCRAYFGLDFKFLLQKF